MDIHVFRCLEDNLGTLVHDPASGDTAAIDVPESEPVERALAERGWTLSHVLLTHHDADHTAGVESLRKRLPCAVYGPRLEQQRLPSLDRPVDDLDQIEFGNGTGLQVLLVPGHTRGHVAYHFQDCAFLATGDSLMTMGCGRVFEGSMAQMHASLTRLAALPDGTRFVCGHDYTAENIAFARTILPDDVEVRRRAEAAESANRDFAMLQPARLDIERRSNPFLRCDDPQVSRAMGLTEGDPIAVFSELRLRKDAF